MTDSLILINNVFLTDMMGYTGENSLKRKFYNNNLCYVHKDLLPALNNIQKELNQLGYQLCIIDAYRPLDVQIEIFNIIKDTKYVSDPKCSRHPRGTAVDVTICDMNGKKLTMPTDFSAFGEKCWAHSECNEEAFKNRQLLQKIMTNNNFEIYQYEWWHFDFKGWCDDEKYPPINMPI